MRDLANAIHMQANHSFYFPHWSRERYARMWANWNCPETLICGYEVP